MNRASNRNLNRIVKRLLFVAGGAVILAGCSENWSKPKPSTFRAYDRYLNRMEVESERMLARRLAEDQPPVCVRDRLASAKNLQAEIERLDKSRGGVPQAGVVAGVDLSGLNPSQAAFLRESAELYNTSSFAMAMATSVDCVKSVTCLLDSIYRQAYQAPVPEDNGPKWPNAPIGDEALLSYHWFQRTGTTVAGIESVPGFTPMTAPLSRFLFSSEELRILNEVAYRLPPLYRKMWSIKSLHKVPYGYSSGSGGIADASSGSFSINGQFENGQMRWRITSTPGYIRFFHEGLKLSREEGGFIYDTSLRETAVHELSHELDLVLDNPGKELLRVSESKEWASISGWHLVSAVAPSGLVYYEWKSDPEREQFVRWYAGTDPNEDFADTAAYFRMEPKRLDKTPQKKAFISGWLYGGRTFDDAGNLDYFQSFIEKELLNVIPDQIQSCLGVQDVSQVNAPTTYVAEGALGLSLPEGLERKCLASRFNSDLDDQFRRLRYHEWEACDFLKPDVVRVIAERQAKAWSARVNELVALGANTSDVAARLKKSLEEFEETFDPRESYVACYGEPESPKCYAEHLDRLYAGWLSRQPADLVEILTKLKRLQLKENTFEVARFRSIESVNGLIAGASDLVWTKTDAVWNACKESRSEIAGAPRLEPYVPSEQYVRAGILDCLNRRLAEDFRQILIAYAQGKFKWASEKALNLAVDRLHKKSRWILDLRVRRAAGAEWAKWQKLSEPARTAVATPAPETDCVAELEPKLNAWIQALPASERPAEDYYTREEIARHWTKRRCPSAPSS